MEINAHAKIIVCGDSFCSADTTANRWHFSQLLQDQHGYNIINLARGGMSNTGICVQIKQALLLKPLAIVYNMADPSRIDIPLNGSYCPPWLLKNFIYASVNDSSTGSTYVGGPDAPIFSTVYQLLDQIKHVTIPTDKIQAVKHYHAHLFDWQLKYETDTWMLNHWQQQAIDQGILTLPMGSPHDLELSSYAKPAYDFVKADPNYPALYHTDLATQQQVANNIHNYLQKHLTL
jgi:hypothetical protein